MQRRSPIGFVYIISNPFDQNITFIILILDIANNFLKNVLQGHNPDHTAILVMKQRQLVMAFLQVRHQLIREYGFWNK